MISIRCSSLPLLAQCAAASVSPQVHIEGADAAARLGTAVHECLAAYVRGESWDAHAVALRHDADADETLALMYAGVRCWKAINLHFPSPATEVLLSHEEAGLTLTGHADVVSIAPDRPASAVNLADWKTGRLDESHDDQLKGYAFLAAREYDVDEVRACVVRVRDGTADWTTWTRADLYQWWEGFRGWLLSGRGTYHAGRHCTHCPRTLECEAHELALKVSGYVLANLGDDDFAGDPDDLVLILDRTRAFEKVIEYAKLAVRARVAAAGGRLETSDGRVLELVSQHKREIDYRRGVEPLMHALPDEALDDCFRVNKTAVEKAVMAGAPRGQKTAAIKELYARLENSGAIITSTVERLEVR